MKPKLVSNQGAFNNANSSNSPVYASGFNPPSIRQTLPQQPIQANTIYYTNYQNTGKLNYDGAQQARPHNYQNPAGQARQSRYIHISPNKSKGNQLQQEQVQRMPRVEKTDQKINVQPHQRKFNPKNLNEHRSRSGDLIGNICWVLLGLFALLGIVLGILFATQVIGTNKTDIKQLKTEEKQTIVSVETKQTTITNPQKSTDYKVPPKETNQTVKTEKSADTQTAKVVNDKSKTKNSHKLRTFVI